MQQLQGIYLPIQVPDIYADVRVVTAKTKFFTDVTAYMVVTFYICECRDHLSVHSDCIETAMVNLYVAQSALFKM